MAEINIGKISRYLSKLLVDIVNYPLELQLVWLTEILLYTVISRENYSVDKVYVHYSEVPEMLAAAGLPKNTSSLLFKFRNTYVHLGHTAALPILRTLIQDEPGLGTLADYAGVSLSYNKTLYKALEKIEVC